MDGVGSARREEGRLAGRLYQQLKQEKMVACAGERRAQVQGRNLMGHIQLYCNYQILFLIKNCSKQQENFQILMPDSRPLSSKFCVSGTEPYSPGAILIYSHLTASWLWSPWFSILRCFSYQLFLPPQATFEPAGRTEVRCQHCSLLFSVMQLIVISICWEMRLEEPVWGKEVRRNVRRVGLRGSDQSLAS